MTVTKKKGKEERLERINDSLRRGDINAIAEMAGVHRVWVSYVLHGKGTSEPVLRTSELFIRKREQREERNKPDSLGNK